MTRKPLAWFRLDLSRFGLEIGDCSGDAALAAWVRGFHRNLVLQDAAPGSLAYDMIQDAVGNREKDAKRKRPDSDGTARNPVESGGGERNPADSRHQSVRPVSQSDRERAMLPPKFSEDARKLAQAFGTKYLPKWAPRMKAWDSERIEAEAVIVQAMIDEDGRSAGSGGDIHQMLDWVDEFSRGDFSWRKTIRGFETLRKKWNEGRLDGFEVRK